MFIHYEDVIPYNELKTLEGDLFFFEKDLLTSKFGIGFGILSCGYFQNKVNITPQSCGPYSGWAIFVIAFPFLSLLGKIIFSPFSFHHLPQQISINEKHRVCSLSKTASCFVNLSQKKP